MDNTFENEAAAHGGIEPEAFDAWQREAGEVDPFFGDWNEAKALWAKHKLRFDYRRYMFCWGFCIAREMHREAELTRRGQA